MMTVRDVMTTSVVSVVRSTPLKDVARLLIDHRISGVPVVDVDGSVLGVVTEADFLLKQQGAEAVHHRRLERLLGESAATLAAEAKLAATTAGAAMTSPAVTIEPSTSLHEAARQMTERRVNRLPVVAEGRLVGIVTRADLVRAFVRSDEQLAGTIRDDVLHRLLWLDPIGFGVDVRDGVAGITGRVERRSTAEMIERSIRMVPGVVDVRNDIEWTLDDRDIEPVTLDAVFPFSPR